MAKRNTTTKNADPTTGGATGSESGSGSAEDRVIALAEQLGRIVGTMQAKAGGLVDRDALMQQISQVRDGATHLLEQFGVGVSAGKEQETASANADKQEVAPSRSSASRQSTNRGQQQQQKNRGAAGGRQKASAERSANTGRQNNQPTTRGRSGGVVDAPGKKHRKPVPNEVRANAADTGRLAKMKMVNANRRRGR
jgi:hypothetical protein